MLKNFIVTAIRNLRKNGLYSVINISGLAIGIACSILIILWVKDETSYDSFHPKADRLYQVWINAAFDGSINSWRSVPLSAYEAMKTADSRIVRSLVTDWGGEHLLTVGDTRINKQGYWASEEFFEMFEFPLITGDPETALDDPSSIVISKSLSEILFTGEDPMGKIIRVDDETNLKVTGLMEDVPNNSSFEFDYILPWKKREALSDWVRRSKTNWDNNSFQVFLELTSSGDELAVEENIVNMIQENSDDDFERLFFLHPLLEWRLYSTFEDGKQKGGMSDYVNLFSAIAGFILLIACINFMNLATARSEKRAKEVGIRKSFGSRRNQLIFQFIAESVLISTIAFIIAIVLALMALPAYNLLVSKELFIDFTSFSFWLFSMAVILVTGVISGSYPAFYLSSFKPVATLKGPLNVGKSGIAPRKVLVVLQFGFSILLMISTIVINQQIELVKSRELGYDQENLVTVDITDDIMDNYDALETGLMQSGAIESMTRSNSSITQVDSNNFLGWPGKPEEERVIFTTIAGGYNYAKTMGIDVIMGRDFSREFTTDTSAVVVNKAALEIMQLEEPIIGTSLDVFGEKRKLIGVIDDVLMGSLYREIKPMFMVIDDWGGSLTIRLAHGKDLQTSLKAVEEVFAVHNPAYPFEYTFVDADFQEKFATINMTQRLSGIFSALTIMITGLGLFGLAAFTAEQRRKEIGIRKVLGATVSSLVTLISKDFSKLVIIAFVISAPLGWYLMDQYLQRYPLRTDIQWWIFALSGFVALAFAILIVGMQARKSAQSNPVTSLRSE